MRYLLTTIGRPVPPSQENLLLAEGYRGRETGADMHFGLHALGIGTGASTGVIRAVSSAAEAAGFATLWAGEHVVMVDAPVRATRTPGTERSRSPPTPTGWIRY